VLDFPSPDSLNADETLKITEQLHEKWGTDPIIHLSICPHAPYTCGKENLLKSKKLAEKLGLPLHMHVAETVGEVAEFRLKYGVSPVQYLENIGFLDERVIAVHCVQVNHQDMEIFRERKVKVSHCQESNMKLASGSPPIVEMQDKGIVVGLGTDGAASNNNLDMFDEMDAVAKYHKAVRGDPTIMDAKTVLRMATRDGAKVLQRENLGKLVVGATADVIIIDLNRPHLTPLYNIYSHLVYSAGGGEVDTVIINGRLVMENRTILTIDEGEVLDRARHLAERIKNEVKNI
jgi:5-methylthioadenosine/S-adenosylhomocysteine deaminase